MDNGKAISNKFCFLGNFVKILNGYRKYFVLKSIIIIFNLNLEMAWGTKEPNIQFTFAAEVYEITSATVH
jgi:hypothetical protein